MAEAPRYAKKRPKAPTAPRFQVRVICAFTANGRERLSYELFAGVRTVDLRCIKERDASFVGCTNDCDALVLGCWGPVVGSDAQASQTKFRDLLISQFSEFHLVVSTAGPFVRFLTLIW